MVWLPVVSVLGIYLARMAELRARRDTVAGPVCETTTLRLFVLAGSIMLFGGMAEFLTLGKRLDGATFVAGWICGLASFAVRRRAIAALGRFWSLHVEIRDGHEFVTTGPFRWMRHPTYFSMVLELASAALILQAPLALTLAALLFLPTLARRLRLEEAALIEKFGDRYREYQRRTPAVFPYKWPAR